MMLNFIDSDKITKNFTTKIYHYLNIGRCGFVKSIFSVSNIDCETISISTSEYLVPVKRLQYTMLNKDKITTELNTIPLVAIFI